MIVTLIAFIITLNIDEKLIGPREKWWFGNIGIFELILWCGSLTFLGVFG